MPCDILSEWLRGLQLVPWVNFIQNDLQETSDVPQSQNKLQESASTDRHGKLEVTGTPTLFQVSHLVIHG